MPEIHWALRHDTGKLTASCHDDPITLNLEPDKFVDLVVLSVEEARELWININGKDVAGYGNTAFGAKSEYVYAQKVAKSLGGYATKWYVKIINDKPYIILKGYNRQLKTLLAGNIWKATNPKLVQFGIGPGAIKASLKGNIIVTIFFSIAVNAVDTMIKDEKTMIDFLGNTGSDIVKGLTALAITAISLAGIAAVGIPVSLVGGSVFFFLGSNIINFGLNKLDESCGATASFIDYWKNEVRATNEHQIPFNLTR
jgi:hypothetical protein